MKRLKAWAGVLLIFFFGLVVGSVLTTGIIYKRYIHLVESGPEAVMDAAVIRLRRELKLSDDQRELLKQIVIETRVKLAIARQPTRAQVRQVFVDSEQKVRGILDPAQTKTFDSIVKSAHEKWDVASQPISPTPAPSTPPPATPAQAD
jgi:hypothetical protein